MTNYTDAMLDIETLGTGTDAVILSAGVVLFNLEEEDDYDTLDDENRSWYNRFNVQEQLDHGHSVTYDTIHWWMKQGVQAKQVFSEKVRFPNDYALTKLVSWLGNAQETVLWGNGSGFDIPIFRALFKTYGIDFPFRFWNENDFRTLRRLAGGKKFEIDRGTIHHALEDAKYQVLAAQEYYRRVNQG